MKGKLYKVTPNNCIKFSIVSLIIISLSLNTVLFSETFIPSPRSKVNYLSHEVRSLFNTAKPVDEIKDFRNSPTFKSIHIEEATDLSSYPIILEKMVDQTIEELNNQYTTLRESGDIEGYINLICQDYDIRPELIKAIIQVESNWNVNATNGPHIGLMQINQYIHSGRMTDLGLDNITDPFNNVLVGTDLMSDLLKTYGGDEGAALTAYNTGSYKGYYTYYATKVLNIANN